MSDQQLPTHYDKHLLTDLRLRGLIEQVKDLEARLAYLEERNTEVIDDLNTLDRRLRNNAAIEWYEAEDFGSGLTD